MLLPRVSPPETPEQLSAETLLRQGYQLDQLPEPWQGLPSEVIFAARNHFLQAFDPVTKNFQDLAPRVHRFGYVETDQPTDRRVDLTIISDYETLRSHYLQICEQAIATIDQAFPKLFQLFSPFFTSFQPVSDRDFNQLKANLENILKNLKLESEGRGDSVTQVEAPYALQYFYDYLSQLVAAYYELAEAAFDLMDDAAPDPRRFPKFLMLGRVPFNSSPTTSSTANLSTANLSTANLSTTNQVTTDVSLINPVPTDLSTTGLSTTNPFPINQFTINPSGSESVLHSAYRSDFLPSPIYSGNHLPVEQVRYLYDRLLLLCETDSFYLLPFYDTPLKITPSRDRSAPLSAQAIPFYLNYPRLYRAWSYDAYRKGRTAQQPAYFLPKPAPTDPPVAPRDELLFRVDADNFYRIEGHIGNAKSVALKRLQDYRQRYNLAFDIVALKLGKVVDIQDLSSLGHLEALNADFTGVKDIFQQLWHKYYEDWSKNVFLCTLKQVFFDQPDVSQISADQLYNPIVAAGRSGSQGNYEFEAEKGASNQPTGRYKLFIRNVAGMRLARCLFTQGSAPNPTTDLLDFAGLSPAQVTQEQQRIVLALSTGLGAERFTYSVEAQTSGEVTQFSVCLTIADHLDLPIALTTGKFQGLVNVKLISQNHFTVGREQTLPIVIPAEFQDFETLYGCLRDIPDSYADQNHLGFQMGNHAVAVDYIDAFDLKGRIEAYQQQAEQILSSPLNVFNQFAQHYPGMEHGGGVPAGGTFILVYVDGKELVRSLLMADINPNYQARTSQITQSTVFPPVTEQELATSRDLSRREDIVVADYCLPYRCSPHESHSHHADIQLRPIVLLEKNSFCVDDSTAYEFLLNPLNGNLKGEGSFFKAGKYYFQPSRIRKSITTDAAILFTYVVEGRYNTLAIAISPLPDADFQVGGEADKTHFCGNDGPVYLIPQVPGGSFQALAAGQDVSATVLNPHLQLPQFDPRKVDLGGAAQQVITLKYAVTNDQGCTNQSQRDITIHALPNANFLVGDGTTHFCADVATVVLKPQQPNGVFRALVGNQDISARVLAGDRFLPSAVKLGQATEQALTLEYRVTSDQGCTHSTTQTVTIFALPDAEFRVDDPSGQTTFCANHGPVALVPNQAGGTFQAMMGTRDISAEVLNRQTNPPQFLPQQVPLGIAKRLRISLNYQVQNAQGCQHQSQQLVMVVALPDASFQIGESNATHVCSYDGPIGLKPQEAGGSFRAFAGDQEISSRAIHGSQFDPRTVDLGSAAQKVITLKYEVTNDQGCTNQSQRDITIHALPNADFRVGDGTTHFCADVATVVLTPNQPNGVFRALVGNQDISARVLAGDRFLPSAVNLGQATEQALTLEYRVTSDQGCTHSTAQTVTIFALPDADFQIGDPSGPTTFCADHGPVALIPHQAGGTFQAMMGKTDISQAVLNRQTNPPQFWPQQVPLGGAKRMRISLNYQVQSPQGCSNQSQQLVMVVALPDASFQVGEANETRFYADDAPVALKPKQSGGTFQVLAGEHDISAEALDPQATPPQFKPSAVQLGEAEQGQVTIAHTIVNSSGCRQQSSVNLIVQRPTVAAVQSLDLVTIDPAGESTVTPVEDGQTFHRSDFNANHQYCFEAVTGSGFGGSVIFTHVPPSGSEHTSGAVNAAPYRMPELWEPIVGQHQIKAQPFRKANGGGLAGAVLTIALIIINEPPPSIDPPQDSPTPASPDSSPTSPDSSSTELDSSPASADSSPVSPDSSSTELDSSSTSADSSPASPDNSSTELDSSPSPLDSSPSQLDSSSPDLDSSPSPLDSLPSPLDSSPSPLDNSSTDLNSSPSELDSSPSELDSSPASPDSSPGQLDNSPASPVDPTEANQSTPDPLSTPSNSLESAAPQTFMAGFPLGLTATHPANLGNPLGSPNSPPSAARRGGNPGMTFLAPVPDRPFQPPDIAASQPASPAPPALLGIHPPASADATGNRNGNPIAPWSAETAQSPPDLPVPPPATLLPAPSTAPPQLRPGLRTKLTQALTLGTIAALLILGWIYAKPSGSPTAPNNPDKLQTSAP